jgi:hypothetical protein
MFKATGAHDHPKGAFSACGHPPAAGDYVLYVCGDLNRLLRLRVKCERAQQHDQQTTENQRCWHTQPNVGDERQLQAREARRKLSARSTG